VRLIAFAALAVFLATSFRSGWNRAETDFPNYYTAAVLATKGAPLHDYYNWTWFQRQMNYAGIENQLGGYIPQTPLTMAPMIPIAGFPVQTAKRIWLLLNLLFLGAAIWMLSRLTRFTFAQVALLAFCGWGSLDTNFLLGQYYVFLLFLITLAFYSQSSLFGVALALKLYGAPFLFYFAVKRRWKDAAGMIAAALCLTVVAIAMFGWHDIVYFATQILPRALEGETLDPYNTGNGTFATLLRRAFVTEPELNPHPLWNAPWMFFFLRPLVTLLILIIPLLAIHRSNVHARDFAWFFIAILLASPNTASYTFTLLLLPITLLLDDAKPWERAILLSLYILLTNPMPFPKVWLVLALFLFAGHHYWRLLSWKPVATATAAAILIALIAAGRSLAAYRQEPGQHWERIAVQQGAIYSSSPAVLRSGIVYESIGPGHYTLRWLHSGRIDQFQFEGEALHPVALSPEGPIEFELVVHRTSTTMLLDPATGKLQTAASRHPEPHQATSPDGKWIAFTSANQIWVRSVVQGTVTRLTGGNCNSSSPAWELDSQALIFASDCSRGIGLPALYRASTPRIP
jgi:hypothetical protein